MTQLSAELLRSSTNGTWIARLPEIALPVDRPADLPALPVSALHVPITGVSTDTRAIAPGNLFVALRGERFDAHEFLLDAVRAGAVALVVDDASRVPQDGFKAATGGRGVGVLKVADTGKALLAIAAAYRRTFTRTKVIAVCGSNGKTTTTRLIHAVLSTTLRGSHSPKSFNNSVGVPLTLLAVQPGDQYVVCEVGTSAPGEIAALADVVRPDIAVITSIGREHLEFLGSLEGVAREESAIIKALNPKSGVAVVNADSPELMAQVRALGDQLGTLVTFGSSEQASLRVANVRQEFDEVSAKFVLRFSVNARSEYTLPTLGTHNAVNALAAIAVAKRLNIDEARLAAGLASAAMPELRLDQRRVALPGTSEHAPGPVHVIADCYNANPDSMLAAVRTLLELEWPPLTQESAASAPERAASRRVCVLGDMLELGGDSAQMHAEVLNELARLSSATTRGVDLVVCVGDQMGAASAVLAPHGWREGGDATNARSSAGLTTGRGRQLVRVAHVAQPELADAVAALLRPDDLVLLKGSRRMGLERVLHALERRAACAQSDAHTESNPPPSSSSSTCRVCKPPSRLHA